MIIYNVYCRIPDPAHAKAWEEWMRDKHMQDVINAGAQSATLSLIEDDSNSAHFEVRYLFASQDSYDDYITHQAPRLRAEGAKLFPPGPDFIYSRNHARIIAAKP